MAEILGIAMDPGGGGPPPGVEAVAGAPGEAKDTPNHPCRSFRRQAFRRFADGCDALGGQVSRDDVALRACTPLSFGHSARVRAGSSATSITPRPRKKHGEKCWRRLRWRRTQSGLGSPTMTKRPSIAAACAAPRLRPLRAPTDGAWLALELGLGYV